jgi:hypothetical protein
MIVKNKKAIPLPVQLRSQDRGYMYCQLPDYLHVLRALDQLIRSEFTGSHGREVVKVN